jgi:hypothetical protein
MPDGRFQFFKSDASITVFVQRLEGLFEILNVCRQSLRGDGRQSCLLELLVLLKLFECF